ncbi:Swainsonine transporter swnT [Colletotrichum aenigma]|uniref:Swainsonine transporter swnT n=1 Tax=Colletotrichum aenigma TaxID=1215731 RepID=UPI001872870E|nr:Swainsonine transporter swnT [Colletotrichum aenigma]KAF5519593.1 Swainsonine transporter swnT [Colletotrichum aenigma]
MSTLKDKEKAARTQSGNEVAGESQSINLPVAEDGHMERPFTTWTAIGIAHSITNTAMGILLTVGTTVPFGGAPLSFFGFILMALVGLSTATSLAELASAIPHLGGQYVWVARLSPASPRRFLSYATAIASWAGAVCTGASVCLTVPQVTLAMVAMTRPDFEYKPWMGFIGYHIINILTASVSCFERILPQLGSGCLIFTVLSIMAIVVSLFAGSTERVTSEQFSTDYYNISCWPKGVAFIIGINGLNWSFSCLDAVVHIAEEIPQPSKNIPKALVWTIAVGFTTGRHAYYFGTNKHAAFGLQSLLLVSTTGAMFGVQTWQSRLTWAFARSRGFPFQSYLRRMVPSPFNTPVWAILWSACWTALLSFVYLASETAFSSLISCGILLQYLSYAVPLVLLLCHGRPNFAHGPFWLPKLGYLANFVTLAWTAVALVVYCFPYYLPVSAAEMNYISVILVLIGLYIIAYWVLWGSQEFVLPEVEDTCKLDITEIRTCEPQDRNLYTRFKLEGPNQVLWHETPQLSAPGLSINPSKPLELKEAGMQYILKITGRHDKDDVEFKYGLLTWTTDSTSGFAKCRGVTADDWNKGGSHCRTDSRQFQCEFAC